jgi:glucose/arabinose dehydrogenase
LKKRWLVAAVAWVAMGGGAAAQHFPPIPLGDRTVALERVAVGLADPLGGEEQVAPTDVVPFPDGSGRLAVATLGGVVRVIDGSGQLLAAPLLTRAESGVTVPESGEYGMTAIAFDPGFAVEASPGYGTFYTINPVPGDGGGTIPDFGPSDFNNHQDVVTAWTLDDHTDNEWDLSLGDSNRELFRVGRQTQIHNVVALAIGPEDGLLYVSSGDGSGADSPQNPSTVAGTILRIDPHGTNSENGKYGIPPGNPFVGSGTIPFYSVAHPEGIPIDPLDEVYAYGFRSPYRMHFDRSTGDLYVGDVGQQDIEEVNLVLPGQNYGWNIKEGSLRSGLDLGSARVEPDTPALNQWSNFTQTLADWFDLTDPVFEYDHDEGVVVVAGFVYRGTALPELAGRFVFGDLGEQQPTARLFSGDPMTGEFEELRIAEDSIEFSNGERLPTRLLSIGEDLDGELLLATVAVDPRNGGGLDGEVVAVVPVPEPAGPALAAAGAAALLALRARRRSAR